MMNLTLIKVLQKDESFSDGKSYKVILEHYVTFINITIIKTKRDLMKHLLLLSVIFTASESCAMQKRCTNDTSSKELVIIAWASHNRAGCPTQTPSPIKHLLTQTSPENDFELTFDCSKFRYSPTNEHPTTPPSPIKPKS